MDHIDKRDASHINRVLSLEEIRRLVCLSSTTLWRLERQGHFPRRIKIGARRVGWLETEINAWLDDCAARRRRAP